MPKRKHTTPLPLFEQLADADQLRALLPADAVADARAFKAEQKRKSKSRRHVPLAKALATGPACLRCVYWSEPRSEDEFGFCRELVKTLDDAPWSDVVRGTSTDRDTAMKVLKVTYEPLLTGEAFHCSAYKHAADLEAA